MSRKDRLGLLSYTCGACKRSLPINEFKLSNYQGMRVPSGDCKLCIRINFRGYMKAISKPPVPYAERMVQRLEKLAKDEE